MQVQAYASTAARESLRPWTFNLDELGPNQVDVRVTHCGICHTDVAMVDNEWGISQYPVVPGHEIVGTVAAIGSAVARLQVGQRVGVGALCGSCMRCEWCDSGAQHVCAQVGGTVMGEHKGVLPPSFASTIGSLLTPCRKQSLPNMPVHCFVPAPLSLRRLSAMECGLPIALP